MISNLEYYRSFYYVAKLGSFTEAAGSLFVTQSAVSQNIAKLEKELGVKLFERNRKGVTLTADGELLFRDVDRAMESLHHGELMMRESGRAAMEELHIGATETVVRFFLAGYLKQLEQERPNCRVFLHGATTTELVGLLEADEVSMTFMIEPLPEMISDGRGSYNIKKVGELQDILVAAAGCELDFGKHYTVEELSKLPLISVSEENSVRQLLDQWFLKAGSRFTPQYTVKNMSLVMTLVEQGFGIGIVPEQYAQEAIKKGTVRTVDVEAKPAPRGIYLVTK